MKNCIICNKIIIKNPTITYEQFNKQKYCSRQCKNIGQKNFKHSMKTKIHWSKIRKGRKLTQEWKNKISKAQKGKKRPQYSGKNNPNWKGGKYKNYAGYIYILKPSHPFANSIGYIRRSRLVIEKNIGRYLTPKEIVHHINGVKDDDRPKNLKLFENISEHRKFHKL
jgi:predicted nucleic acid-binding Zn ribbon protein